MVILWPLVSSIILSLVITSLATFEYVLVNRPVPSFIPPKYLTTIISA